jgi:excisionase family DNA binding protein
MVVMNKDLPDYLTLAQVAELLQVHPNTLRNWDKNGTLKAIRIGVRKVRRYKKTDIFKLLEHKDE